MARRQGPDGSIVDTRTGRAAKGTYPQAAPVTARDTIRWGDVNAELQLSAADAVTSLGDGFSIARNRPGTCLIVTILTSGVNPKYYCETVEETERLLILLAGVAG